MVVQENVNKKWAVNVKYKITKLHFYFLSLSLFLFRGERIFNVKAGVFPKNIKSSVGFVKGPNGTQCHVTHLAQHLVNMQVGI